MQQAFIQVCVHELKKHTHTRILTYQKHDMVSWNLSKERWNAYVLHDILKGLTHKKLYNFCQFCQIFFDMTAQWFSWREKGAPSDTQGERLSGYVTAHRGAGMCGRRKRQTETEQQCWVEKNKGGRTTFTASHATSRPGIFRSPVNKIWVSSFFLSLCEGMVAFTYLVVNRVCKWQKATTYAI